MGQHADDLIEEGFDNYTAHMAGQCGPDICQYCEERPMVDRSNRVTLSDDDIMPWGMHKGKRLGDIPDSYWRWMLDQDWCDQHPDLMAYAECID